MLNLKAVIAKILTAITDLSNRSVKSIAFTGTTSAAGTLTVTSLSGHTIVGIQASSVSGTSYAVVYGGNVIGFFNYAAPHNPLANTSVTLTVLYV